MAGDPEGAARRARDGVGVSSGESSASVPNPAFDPEGATLPGVDLSNTNSQGTPQGQSLPKSAPPSGVGNAGADAMTVVEGGASKPPSSGSTPPHPIFSSIGATIFHEGDVLGGRYEIHKMLGMGGMGAVYKARDMEVERAVGLKVIRPDLAGNPAILARFKQELVLARQVTHKNIIRIYDLNEADGVKFITMEYIEGEDLRTILTRQGKLSPEEAVGIILQTCAGLQAAHVEGVIHRDLKPSNIMQDQSGRVVIMDFGLARTVQGDGMTQTGMMIGTMEYMSPEQAMGKDLDARSDQFSVGLIFYELLSGFIPFHAESAIASLVKRTQERAVPLVDVDSSIPPDLSNIVAKCLERDPQDRFASVDDLIDELLVWQGKKVRSGQSITSRPVMSTVAPVAVPVPAKQSPKKWIAIGVAALVLAVGAVVGVRYATRPGTGGAGDGSAVQGPVTSLAIVPFYNASGDASVNWMGVSIAEALSSDIGQSAHLRLVSPDRLQQVLHDLGVSSQSQLDLSTLRRIADYTHADTIVSGKYEKFGDQTRIGVTIHDFKNDHDETLTADVPNENDLLGSLEKLSVSLREKVAASPEVLKELQTHSQHVTTKSIPALKAYDEGSQLMREGNNTQALAKFQEATIDDPTFAMAFSKLAQAYAATGFEDKAETASRRAVELSDNLPEQDRYVIKANHASIMHDTAKAIEAYENLAKLRPDDPDVQFRLAKLYQEASNFDQAKKYLAKVLASDPKNVGALLASGQVDLLTGNYQAALDPLTNALNLAIQFDNQEEKGAILSSLGLAYQYLDKPEDALRNYQQALEIRKKVGDQRGVASTLGQLAQLQETADPKAALQDYNQAIEIQRKIGDNKGLAKSLVNLGSLYIDHLGKYDDALNITKEALQLARDSGDQVLQATCLQNIGNAHFYKGEYQDALTYYGQALDIQEKLKLKDDMTNSLHNLGDTNGKLGQYNTAVDQYMKALEARRAANDKGGIALESSDMGIVFSAQGRYGAALKAQQEAVSTYQSLNDRSNLMISALAEYGHTLSAVGREDEGQKKIEQALQLAADTKSDPVEALNYLGDAYFYRGDYGAAKQQYEKALQLASKAKLPDQVVIAKLNLAKLDVVQGRGKSAIGSLKKLAQDADSLGLKAQSVQASVYLGEALLAANQVAAAQDQLDGTVGRAEKLGLRVEQAQAQYFLGKAMALGGKVNEAIPHYREAVRILESISKDDGAGRVLERSDLKDVYHDAAKSYQGGS